MGTTARPPKSGRCSSRGRYDQPSHRGLAGVSPTVGRWEQTTGEDRRSSRQAPRRAARRGPRGRGGVACGAHVGRRLTMARLERRATTSRAAGPAAGPRLGTSSILEHRRQQTWAIFHRSALRTLPICPARVDESLIRSMCGGSKVSKNSHEGSSSGGRRGTAKNRPRVSRGRCVLRRSEAEILREEMRVGECRQGPRAGEPPKAACPPVAGLARWWMGGPQRGERLRGPQVSVRAGVEVGIRTQGLRPSGWSPVTSIRCAHGGALVVSRGVGGGGL